MLAAQQIPSATVNFSGLTYTQEDNVLSVVGSALTPSGTFQVDQLFDLSEQAAAPLVIQQDGSVIFDTSPVNPNVLVHLGYWDGTDFTYIDHSAG